MAAAALTLVQHSVGQDCLVANPSFEVGSGLDGWNVLNDVTIGTTLAAHGGRAVSIGTPGGSDWGISAVWQRRDASPGEVFTGAVRVGHEAGDPLTGAARGIVNVEWRDDQDALIGYESFDVLGAGDATGRLFGRGFVTPPAPAGTASARLLLGTLQSPAGESGRAVFDLAELTPTGYDELQWNDFPGGREIAFAGCTWRVKGPGVFGPGPNTFGDAEANAVVTGDGLRVAITGGPGAWSSTELVLEEPLGYGDYVFTTRGRVDTIADNVVLGLFLWEYPVCYSPANEWNQHNEIDVEISRWGDPGNENAQFVVQPYDRAGNIERFELAYTDDELVSYAFNWLPGRVDFRAWRGGPDDESPASLIRAWSYSGAHLPTPEQPRVHINLWHLDDGPSDGQAQSVTFADFRFRAMGDADGDGVRTYFDVLAFLGMFAAHDPAADLNGDGAFTVRDQVLFVVDGLGDGLGP